MGLWTPGSIQRSAGKGSHTSAGISATSGAAHTKGAWTAVISSTACDWAGFYIVSVSYLPAAATNKAGLFDVGVGASGSEVVIVPDLNNGKAAAHFPYFCPMYVKAGSRVSVRHQNATASTAASFYIVGIPLNHWSGPEPCKVATTYGTSAATSAGTVLTTPGATNTLTAWQQLTASTTYTGRWLLPQPGCPSGSTVDPAGTSALDFGFGASGSEQPIVEGVLGSNTTSEEFRATFLTLPINIAKGSRLVVRHMVSLITTPMNTASVTVFS